MHGVVAERRSSGAITGEYPLTELRLIIALANLIRFMERYQVSCGTRNDAVSAADRARENHRRLFFLELIWVVLKEIVLKKG